MHYVAEKREMQSVWEASKDQIIRKCKIKQTFEKKMNKMGQKIKL